MIGGKENTNRGSDDEALPAMRAAREGNGPRDARGEGFAEAVEGFGDG